VRTYRLLVGAALLGQVYFWLSLRAPCEWQHSRWTTLICGLGLVCLVAAALMTPVIARKRLERHFGAALPYYLLVAALLLSLPWAYRAAGDSAVKCTMLSDSPVLPPTLFTGPWH
jgi:hypothetical protein